MRKESELIINSDGSVYHLHLRPEHIAPNVLIVGDPARVKQISKHFDSIEYEIQNREFVTHTGRIGNVRITALATGIGTDNIDIVLNELDAAVNINLQTGEAYNNHTILNIIRLGTSGALQKDIEVDSMVVSEVGLGLDGLLNFYNVPDGTFEETVIEEFCRHTNYPAMWAKPYAVKCSEFLLQKIGYNLTSGITATASGFYAPQGRSLRLPVFYPKFNQLIETFQHNELRIVNFEMETSALYGLSKLLRHNALTICAIIANRVSKQFSKNYQITVEKMIELVLHRLIQ